MRHFGGSTTASTPCAGSEPERRRICSSGDRTNQGTQQLSVVLSVVMFPREYLHVFRANKFCGFFPALLRNGENMAPGKPTSSGNLWIVHSSGAGKL